MSQQFQPPPGHWAWVPTQPQPTSTPDTRLIRHWYEWIIFFGDIAAFVLITASVLVQQISAGWRWPML